MVQMTTKVLTNLKGVMKLFTPKGDYYLKEELDNMLRLRLKHAEEQLRYWHKEVIRLFNDDESKLGVASRQEWKWSGRVEELKDLLGEKNNHCQWTCPECEQRCGGVINHTGVHQCPKHYGEQEEDKMYISTGGRV